MDIEFVLWIVRVIGIVIIAIPAFVIAVIATVLIVMACGLICYWIIWEHMD